MRPEGRAEAVAADLSSRLGRAEIDDGLRNAALKRQADEKARRLESGLAAARAEGAIAALVLEAKVASAAGLADAERASEEVKGLKARLLGLDDQLALVAGPIPPARLLEEARGVDPEAIEPRIIALADALGPLEAERDALNRAIGECRERLSKMDGGPGAADANQAIAERLARLSADVEHYTRLKLASAVLARAIERHREKNQGSVLGRAGDLFAALTVGSFAGLRADVDDKGQPILRGLRGDGVTPLGVESMSEGTADQLYLALRLASLEVHLADPRNEPMPLVVDDILVNFDDARGLAALRALAELSKRTQVLFFTHHDHLIELARAELDPDLLFIHRLDPTAEGQGQGQVEPTQAEAAEEGRCAVGRRLTDLVRRPLASHPFERPEPHGSALAPRPPRDRGRRPAPGRVRHEVPPPVGPRRAEPEQGGDRRGAPPSPFGRGRRGLRAAEPGREPPGRPAPAPVHPGHRGPDARRPAQAPQRPLALPAQRGPDDRQPRA